MLLTSKLRSRILTLVQAGTPVVAAGMRLGVRPAATQRWMATGSQDAPIEKPKTPGKLIDLPGGGTCTEKDFYEHRLECRKLAEAVFIKEGEIAGKLHATLLRLSTGKFVDAATARYMHKVYARVHGYSDEPVADNGSKEDDGGAVDEPITFELPDNGRMSK